MIAVLKKFEKRKNPKVFLMIKRCLRTVGQRQAASPLYDCCLGNYIIVRLRLNNFECQWPHKLLRFAVNSTSAAQCEPTLHDPATGYCAMSSLLFEMLATIRCQSGRRGVVDGIEQ